MLMIFKLATTSAFPNNFRTYFIQVEFILAMKTGHKNQTMEISPLQYNTPVPTLFAIHHQSRFIIFRLLQKIHLQTTKQTFIPPLLNILAKQTVRDTRNKLQIGLFLKDNCFSHELKYRQKQCRLKTISIYKPQTKFPLNFHQ